MRIIGTPLTPEEYSRIEWLEKDWGTGYRHVYQSNTSKSFSASFNYEESTVDLGHRRNPAEAALLYAMSKDPRKPKARSTCVIAPDEPIIRCQYMVHVFPEDLPLLEYLKSPGSNSGYQNVRLYKGAYIASLIIDQRLIYLGRYKTPEEAAMVLHLFFRTGKIIRQKDSMLQFNLTLENFTVLNTFRTALRNSKGKDMEVYVKVDKDGRFRATGKDWKRQISLGRYKTEQEAWWAIYLYLEHGLMYADIAVLARTNKTMPEINKPGPVLDHKEFIHPAIERVQHILTVERSEIDIETV